MSATLSETRASATVPSATLFREGDDLDEVLAELDAEYPGRVHVTEVSYDRQGGVLGFFARRRVGVHFTLADLTGAASAGASAVALSAPGAPAGTAGPLEELLRAAEAAERPHDPAAARLAAAIVESGRAAVPAHEDDLDAATTNLEFARMLLDMANQKAAERSVRSGQPVTAQPVTAVSFTPDPVTGRRPAPTAAPSAAPVVALSADTATRPATDLRPEAVRTHRYLEPDLEDLARRRPVGAHRAATDGSATNVAQPVPSPAAAEETGRSRFTLRRQLVELGVPVDWIPADSADSYWIIEQLVNRLPAAPVAEPGLGEIMVVLGPAAEALRAARQLCGRLRLPAAAIHTAGFTSEAALTESMHTTHHSIHHVGQAARFATELRAAATAPAIVVVASDDAATEDGGDRWAAGIVAALAPEQLWLVVDATCKPADARAQLAGLGRVDALIVSAAARTTSPASVWQLHTPIAMLDGRPATRGAWAALLIDKLSALE